MPRNMSFAMTTEQLQDRSKTVTRRFGWLFLKPGDRVRPVRKAMGLKKGEKIEPLLPPGECIEGVSTRSERLNKITKADCIKEGFPHFTPADFVAMLVRHYRIVADKIVNRIEFKYVQE